MLFGLVLLVLRAPELTNNNWSLPPSGRPRTAGSRPARWSTSKDKTHGEMFSRPSGLLDSQKLIEPSNGSYFCDSRLRIHWDGFRLPVRGGGCERWACILFWGILQSLAIQLGERMLDNAGCLFSFVAIITVSSISFPARRNQRELELRMWIPLCCCRKSTNSRVSYPAMGL